MQRTKLILRWDSVGHAYLNRRAELRRLTEGNYERNKSAVKLHRENLLLRQVQNIPRPEIDMPPTKVLRSLSQIQDSWDRPVWKPYISDYGVAMDTRITTLG